MAAKYSPTPDLLDPNIDSGHRSYLSAVQRVELATLRSRPPRELLWLDQCWFVGVNGCPRQRGRMPTPYFFPLANGFGQGLTVQRLTVSPGDEEDKLYAHGFLPRFGPPEG